MLFYHVSFHPFIFHSDLMSFLSSIIWIQGNLFMRQPIHTPPHKGPQSLFFEIQVVYNSWKWLLYTVNTGWYCYIALRLLQQIKTHGSHTKMLSELWNWVIECNWLWNLGFEQFLQIAANLGKLLQKSLVTAGSCWMLSRQSNCPNAPEVMMLLYQWFFLYSNC